MVLTGSVYSESPARRKIEQISQVKQTTTTTTATSAMQPKSVNGSTTATRFTVLPLRKILVESAASPEQQRRRQQQQQPAAAGAVPVGDKLGGAAAASAAAATTTSRSRNSTDRCKKPSAAPAPARKSKPPQSKSDVLPALSAACNKRRARTPSPVLTRGRASCHRESDTPAPPPTVSSIVKSASVPANLKAGILKRSTSSLLGSFEGRGFRSLLRRRSRNSSSKEQESSSSVPRKCVSFREDTAFEQRKKTAGLHHETKVYRKGVLQDRNGSCGGGSRSNAVGSSGGVDYEVLGAANLPLAWEESLGGPKALLGAAQDADDELVKRIVSLATKSGLGNIDLNAVDSSGRTAISYLAGNGSALMLEACLSFTGADPNLPDNESNTPLHFAAQAGQTECLNILLQRCPSIEVDARNNLGFTPLMKAALQGRTKCAKILLFAGANPSLRDQGRGLKAEQWARFCGRYVCAEVIERFSRHRLLERTTSCRWGSEPELAAQVLTGKLMPIPSSPTVQPTSSPSGLKSKIRRVFRTSSSQHHGGSEKASFSLVTQLTSAALCASSPVLPKPNDCSPVVKSLLRPLSVPQLRITLVSPHQDVVDKTLTTSYVEMVKPPRTKKKSK